MTHWILIERALRIGREKDDAEWLHNSVVDAQMKQDGAIIQREVVGV